MPYPTPEAHHAATGRKIEIQTDKAAFKIVPCTYAGCDVDLVVNTFYAPAKGKCAHHSGKGIGTIAASGMIHATADAKPNGALANLLCPLCSMPLKVISINSVGSMPSHITFACTDGTGIKDIELGKAMRVDQGGFCGTSIVVRPKWAALEMDPIRKGSPFYDFAVAFNTDQKLKYFDLNEARHGDPTT